MKFSDLNEREAVLGPLYATEAKANIPIFGPGKFTSKAGNQSFLSIMKKRFDSGTDPIVNAMVSNDPDLARRLSGNLNPLSSGIEKMNLEAQSKTQPGVSSTIADKIHSSRERHDKSHYTSGILATLEKAKNELLENVMLKRAVDGYLFDCQQNRVIVSDDKWLQDAWGWIQGKTALVSVFVITDNFLGAEKAAKDDGMVSGPLDLSYMGVYTLWKNLLGMKLHVIGYWTAKLISQVIMNSLG
jgi:hypothetical protein